MEDTPSKSQTGGLCDSAKACVSLHSLGGDGAYPRGGGGGGGVAGWLLFCQALQFADGLTATQKGNLVTPCPQLREQGLEKLGLCPELTAHRCLSRSLVPAPWVCKGQVLTYSCPTNPWPHWAVGLLLQVCTLASTSRADQGCRISASPPLEPLNQHLHFPSPLELVRRPAAVRGGPPHRTALS